MHLGLNMKKSFIGSVIINLWIFNAVCGASGGTITASQKSVSAADVHDVGGFVGTRMQANKDHYLKTFDCQRWVNMLGNRTYRDWFWTGEQPGKWLESSILSGCSFQDNDLISQSRNVLAEMIRSQAEDGYLGITADDLRTEIKPLRGMDPYEQYFTLHALITAYEVWNNKEALNAAIKLADYYLKNIGEGKAEFWPSPYRPPENVNTIICSQYTWVPDETKKTPKMYVRSEIAGHTAHYSWEGTMFIDPVTRLYQVTGEKRFLDWCQWVVSKIDIWSGWDSFSKLDQVAAGTLGVHQLQPYVHSHTFHMNFMGFLRLYQATGDKTLLRKVEGAWEDIARRQVYITGGVSVAEHYEPGYNKPLTGHVVETCANMSWLQLNQMLLEITGKPRYADAIESLLINHVFAAQTIDGDSNRYHTPPNGFKPDDYFHGVDCCSSSGHRQISMLPGLFYATTSDGIVVNQYVESSVNLDIKGNRIELKQSTRYPESELSTITLNCSNPVQFSLQLRIPSWCTNPSVTVNGKVESGVKSGYYHSIERKWRNGDSVVIRFPMTTSWIKRQHSETKRWAIIRGPVVYALDTVWWDDNSVEKPLNAGEEIAVDKDSKPEQIPTGERSMGPFYQVSVQLADGQTVKATMVPFCNVGRWYKNEQEKVKGVDPKAYSYAVWLYDPSSQEYKEIGDAIKKQREKYAGAIDCVLIGNIRSEKEHNLQSDRTSSGQFNNKVWRHSENWFSYDLKVSAEKQTILTVGYWGGESTLREFEIYANDKKIADVRLFQNKPGQFFEEKYDIPFDLIKDKTDALGQKVDVVTVKFKAKTNVAGGVFDLYTHL